MSRTPISIEEFQRQIAEVVKSSPSSGRIGIDDEALGDIRSTAKRPKGGMPPEEKTLTKLVALRVGTVDWDDFTACSYHTGKTPSAVVRELVMAYIKAYSQAHGNKKG